MLECIPIIKLLKNDPRYLYVTRVRQPWKGFVKHFILNVLQKNLFDWECITIPRDADTFQYSGTLFSVSEYNFSSFSEWSFSTDECRPRRNVWSVFHLFLTSHLWCCVNSKQQFNIVGIQSFLSKYFFSSFFPHFHWVFFEYCIVSSSIFFDCHLFPPTSGPCFYPWVK